MFLCKIAGFASIGLALALTAGCASEAQAVDGEGVTTSDLATYPNPADEGTFQLYDSVRPARDSGCDVYTALELTHLGTQAGLIARLHEAVEGGCTIVVPADAREVRLVLDSTSCGSNTYKGTTTVDGAGREVTITDHRARYCRDVVAAKIIVEERPVGQGAERTLYSFDPLVAR